MPEDEAIEETDDREESQERRTENDGALVTMWPSSSPRLAEVSYAGCVFRSGQRWVLGLAVREPEDMRDVTC